MRHARSSPLRQKRSGPRIRNLRSVTPISQAPRRRKRRKFPKPGKQIKRRNLLTGNYQPVNKLPFAYLLRTAYRNAFRSLAARDPEIPGRISFKRRAMRRESRVKDLTIAGLVS